MKVTYNGKNAVRVYNLDWQPGETKVVANDLKFDNLGDFKIESVKSEKPNTQKSK